MKAILASWFLFVAALGGAADPQDARHFDLRVYDVTPNRLDAVLERFREHIGRLRVKHGIETLGYWTTTNQSGADVFVYLIAAPSGEKLRAAEQAFGADPEFKQVWAAASQKYGQTVDKIASYPLRATDWSPKIVPTAASPARTFELRIYDVLPDKLAAYLDNYRDARLKLFEKHGFANLGFWTTTATNRPAQFVLLLAHQNPAAVAAAKQAYHADPEWEAAVDAWNAKVGQTTTNVVSMILTPAQFSPWK